MPVSQRLHTSLFWSGMEHVAASPEAKWPHMTQRRACDLPRDRGKLIRSSYMSGRAGASSESGCGTPSTSVERRASTNSAVFARARPAAGLPGVVPGLGAGSLPNCKSSRSGELSPLSSLQHSTVTSDMVRARFSPVSTSIAARRSGCLEERSEVCVGAERESMDSASRPCSSRSRARCWSKDEGEKEFETIDGDTVTQPSSESSSTSSSDAPSDLSPTMRRLRRALVRRGSDVMLGIETAPDHRDAASPSSCAARPARLCAADQFVRDRVGDGAAAAASKRSIPAPPPRRLRT
mmetsp:Transcript_31282/g.105271  ORF Transcript_31282/g.105271 Transcript_31282/m.105271 type:complete len:294 (+) Transcript_31282:262-1143(+)